MLQFFVSQGKKFWIRKEKEQGPYKKEDALILNRSDQYFFFYIPSLDISEGNILSDYFFVSYLCHSVLLLSLDKIQLVLKYLVFIVHSSLHFFKAIHEHRYPPTVD